MNSFVKSAKRVQNAAYQAYGSYASALARSGRLRGGRALYFSGGRRTGVTATVACDDSGDRWHERTRQQRYAATATCTTLLAALVSAIYINTRRSQCSSRDNEPDDAEATDIGAGQRRDDLPDYRRAEIATHDGSPAAAHGDSVWVTFGAGVYDVTQFAAAHPGGDRLMLAAGGDVEPFWRLYAIHYSRHVYETLEELRIGNVHPDDVTSHAAGSDVDADDPFAREPQRSPVLQVNSARPFNAEPPPPLLVDNFNTPADIFFVRNHLPVPDIDGATYALTVTAGRRVITLTPDQLRARFRVHTVTSAIQCAGNRRTGMHRWAAVKGLAWRGTAVSNAEWTGVRLADVLSAAGVRAGDGTRHVVCRGADADMTGVAYETSIPAGTALDPRRDVLIAFEMNGKPLTRDHGYPCRLIVPGTVGARQVKWLVSVTASEAESTSHWQQSDYKVLGPGASTCSEAAAIHEYPVQSAICEPADGARLPDADQVTVRGYALSGGGRGIARVLVSLDGGATWQAAGLQAARQPPGRQWAWTLFDVTLEIPEERRGRPLEIVCKAVDTASNAQPEAVGGIWNERGLLNNAWDRVRVSVPDG